MNYKAHIPYGAYWSTPFARWQGSFANLHSVEFAAHVARAELARRRIDPAAFDHGVLGFSVPQKHSFYGLPWFTGLMGAERVTTQNVEVVSTDADRGLILIRGAVPGTKGAWILVRDAVKSALPADAPKPAAIRAKAADKNEAPAAEAQVNGGAE